MSFYLYVFLQLFIPVLTSILVTIAYMKVSNLLTEAWEIRKLGKAPLDIQTNGYLRRYYNADQDEGFQKYWRARWNFEHTHPIAFWLFKHLNFI